MLTIIGNTTVDLFIRGVESLPQHAEDEFSNNSLIWLQQPVVPTLGGNAANTAYVAAGLGAKARLWGAIGADSLGKMVLGWLRGRGVDLSEFDIIPEAGTSTTVVLTDDRLRRHTFHHSGATQFCAPGRHNLAGGPGDWLLVTGYPLLPCWRGDPYLQLLQAANGLGMSTALDIGPVLGDPVTQQELASLLPSVDLLFANSFELESAIGLQAHEAASWALQQGAGAVVLKLGADGACLFDRENGAGTAVPAFDVPVVGTVGAGDAFNAGVLVALGQGLDRLESVRFGHATAALVVCSARGVLDAPDNAAVRALQDRKNS